MIFWCSAGATAPQAEVQHHIVWHEVLILARSADGGEWEELTWVVGLDQDTGLSWLHQHAGCSAYSVGRPPNTGHLPAHRRQTRSGLWEPSVLWFIAKNWFFYCWVIFTIIFQYKKGFSTHPFPKVLDACKVQICLNPRWGYHTN